MLMVAGLFGSNPQERQRKYSVVKELTDPSYLLFSSLLA